MYVYMYAVACTVVCKGAPLIADAKVPFRFNPDYALVTPFAPCPYRGLCTPLHLLYVCLYAFIYSFIHSLGLAL